mmetsp:Transcript_625/g.1918  ORF Transcript_625/g.1918 Transcript_625/m.1918 type:complete len:133 (-) Transcript_625:362-760(-)
MAQSQEDNMIRIFLTLTDQREQQSRHTSSYLAESTSQNAQLTHRISLLVQPGDCPIRRAFGSLPQQSELLSSLMKVRMSCQLLPLAFASITQAKQITYPKCRFDLNTASGRTEKISDRFERNCFDSFFFQKV